MNTESKKEAVKGILVYLAVTFILTYGVEIFVIMPMAGSININLAYAAQMMIAGVMFIPATGAGLILYLNAFGFAKTERFFTYKTYKRISIVSLGFYALSKSYSFYTGANHLESFIPKGTPGAILSSGLILPLNICVGMVVACTMYGFYAVFRKGGM